MTIINATYRDSAVGTGTYTRNIMAALPEARRTSFPKALLSGRASAFWSKRAAEALWSALPGTVVHPYWAASPSRWHVLTALDLVQYREGTGLDRRALLRAARQARAVLALTPTMARMVEAEIGREVVVAPPFPDRPWFQQPLTQRRPVTGPVRLAYWGGWHQRKGITAFLEGLAGSPLTGEVEVHCLAVPREWAGAAWVHDHGRMSTDRLVRLVDSVDVAVYPSSEEGYGLPVAEALLRQRPIVALPLDVYTDFVNTSPFFVPLDDLGPQSIAAAVERAVSAPHTERAASLRTPSVREATALLRTALTEAVER